VTIIPSIEEFEHEVANLLTTPPPRVLAVFMVLDKGPTRDETGRGVEVRLRFRIAPTILADVMEEACAVVLRDLPPDELEDWLNAPK
jgi:hypothetical protein